MAKYFPLEGSYESLVLSISRVESMRNAAIAAAFQGDFSLALSILIKTMKALPYVPRGWKSHKEIFQEIEHAMQDSFRRNFEGAVLTFNQNMVAAIEQAAKGTLCRDFFDSLMEEHARDMEGFINLRCDLTYMHSITDTLCKREEGLPLERLKGLEQLFSIKVEA